MSPRSRQHRRVRRSTSPLGRVEPTRAEAILLNDTSITRIEASSIARASQGEPSREAKLAHHFVQQNAQTLAQFGIEARVDFDGHRVYLDLLFRATDWSLSARLADLRKGRSNAHSSTTVWLVGLGTLIGNQWFQDHSKDSSASTTTENGARDSGLDSFDNNPSATEGDAFSTLSSF